MALSGDIPKVIKGFKFGAKANVTAGEETIWTEGGRYTFLGSAQNMTLSSQVDSDIDGGDYAWAIDIYRMGDDFVETKVTKLLDGTNGVVVEDIRRVNRMQVSSSGVNQINAQNIYLGTGTITDGIPANVYSRIDSGQGQTLQAFYTVPASYMAEITNVRFTAGRGGDVEFKMFAIKENDGLNVKLHEHANNNEVRAVVENPLIFLPKTDIELTAAKSAGTTADVSGTFNYTLYYGGEGM